MPMGIPVQYMYSTDLYMNYIYIHIVNKLNTRKIVKISSILLILISQNYFGFKRFESHGGHCSLAFFTTFVTNCDLDLISHLRNFKTF